MARLSSIAKLIKGLQGAPHVYENSALVFPSLSMESLAAELKLREKGVERGRANLPASDVADLDEIEHQIAERINSERYTARQIYEDQFRTYSEQITGLDFETRFADIQHIAPAAVSEFHAAATQGRDALVLLRRRIVETEQHREHFRTQNNLRRPAKVHHGGMQLFKASFVLLILLMETVLNGYFLSRGSEQGYLGGAILALTFAILNIIVSFGFGYFLVPQVNHKHAARVSVGILSILVYAVFAVCLNLVLAHYRELSGQLASEIGIAALRHVRSDPLGLADINSWVFFGIGTVFSIGAMLDGLFFRDPYPGYTAVEQACASAHLEYQNKRSELIELLQEIKSDAADAMRETERDLNMRRAEFDDILQARQTLNSKFAACQTQIHRVGAALLALYREANKAARSTPAPATFTQPLAANNIPPLPEPKGARARDDLRKAIAEASGTLQKQVSAIQAEFQSAIDTYKQIDDLMPEAGSGS